MRYLRIILCLASTAVLSACGIFSTPTKGPSVYQTERFASDETFSRLFDADVGETCEAARRALLSQGYVIDTTSPGMVSGAKLFQPGGEVHVAIKLNVVCVPDGKTSSLTTAYVSAQQDSYALKKNPNSTSIGVSALGSISLPTSSTSDSLVKVASETIPAGAFYDRFFALMHRLVEERNGEK